MGLSFKILLSLSFLTFSSAALAQEEKVINSSRPGLSSGPNGIEVGTFQIESGLDTIIRTGSDDKLSNTLDTQIRYGFTDSFEFNTTVDLSHDEFDSRANEGGISEFDLGGRFTVIPEASGWIPALGFIANFKLNSISSEYRAAHPALSMVLATEHDLNSFTSLTLNFGTDYDGNTAEPVYRSLATLTFDVRDHVVFCVEGYGELEEEVGSAWMDAGVGYAINKDTQLDLSAGWGHNHGVSETLITAGISWRTKALARK